MEKRLSIDLIFSGDLADRPYDSTVLAWVSLFEFHITSDSVRHEFIRRVVG